MRLRYSVVALKQVEEIIGHVATHSPRGSTRLRDRILAVASMLEEHPFAGEATSRKGVRRVALTPFPYILFYRVRTTDVVVTRLRHAAEGRDETE